jgi:hypothetical protein
MSWNTWNSFGTRIGTPTKSLTLFRGTRGTRMGTDVSCVGAHVEAVAPPIYLFQCVPLPRASRLSVYA